MLKINKCSGKKIKNKIENKRIFLNNNFFIVFLCSLPGPPEHELTPQQISIVKQAMSKARETVQRLATDHRDLHSTVSKVGKAIDRV